jgi:hypothetical protein
MRVIGVRVRAIRIRVGVIGVRVRAIGVRARVIGVRVRVIGVRVRVIGVRVRAIRISAARPLLPALAMPCERFPSTAPLMRPRPHVPWSARRTSAPHLRRSAVPALPTSAPGLCTHLRQDFAHICAGTLRTSAPGSPVCSAADPRPPSGGAALVRGTSSHPQETQKQINPQTHALRTHRCTKLCLKLKRSPNG